MKRIGIITSTYYPVIGGVANATKAFAEALAINGYQVEVFSFKSLRSKLSDVEVINNVKVRRIHCPGTILRFVNGFSSMVYMRLLSQLLEAHIKAFNPEVLVGQMIYWGGMLSGLCQRFCSATSVTYGHGEDVNQLAGNRSKITLTRKSLRENDVLLTTNTEFAEILGAYTNKRIDILPNIMPDSDGVIEYDLRRQDESFRLICIGRLDQFNGQEIKGFGTALNAMRQLRNCRLDIIGDGLLLEQYRTYVEANGLSRSVLLHGKQQPAVVLDLLKHANVLLLPSTIEGLSMVMLEALHCGVPVIATKVGGARDYIRNWSNGFLIERGDADALAGWVSKIQRDPVLGAEMARNARGTYLENFTPRRVVEKFASIMGQL